MVASVVAFLLGVGVSAPALDELNATWVDKAVAASQTVESGEGAEDNPEYRKSNTPKVVGAAETPKSVTATPGIQSEIAKVVPAVETNLETTVTPVAEWPEGGFTGETTVTYDANGKGSFADGATTNAVTTKYDGFKDVTKYAHTDNVNDAGVQNGGYGDGKSYSRVVTIPGASRLTVDLTYQTEGVRYDWVCAYAGGTESSPAGDAQCSAAGSLTGKLGGTTKTTRSFTVDGDSVTFWFKSDSSNSNFYGYYAVVKELVGSKENVSGEYAAPVDPSDEYQFVSWNTKADGTGENLGAGEVYLPSNQTVYAQWKLNYTKWGTVGWQITDDGTLKIRPWEGDTGVTGSVTSPYTPPWYSKASNIKRVESIGNIVLNSDSDRLFYCCSNLIDITALASWDVSNVRHMSQIFFRCSNLTDLAPLASLDVSKVTYMSGMFEGCSKLTDLTALEHWNVSNVTDMDSMFSDCSKLTDITTLASWNVSNVTDMNTMFSGCSSLTALIGLKNWTVSNVTGMSHMFDGCSSLNDLTALANWDVSNVTDMLCMFSGCSKLTDLTALANWTVSNVEDMSYMFSGCSNLTDLTGLADWTVSNVTNMRYMFSGCSKFTDLTALANWNVSNVTNMGNMFWNCSSLNDLTALANWNVSKVTSMESMFNGCSKLTDLTALANWNVSNVTSMSSVFYNCSKLTDLTPLKSWNVSNVTGMSHMFYNCSKLTDLSALADWNVSKVTNMSYMFSGCSKFTDLTGLKNWNVSNVKYMSYMFQSCSKLTDLTPITGWNVSNVTDMDGMFNGCSKLTDLTALANWNVSKVTNMDYMFSYCSSLTDLTALKNWNVSNVTNMYSMFYKCSNLTDLTALADWNVSNVTNMNYMFLNCSSLTDLTPLTSWNVSNVKNMNSMFSGCSKFTDLTALANWNVSNVTDMRGMFNGCPNLQKVGIPSIANGGQNLVSRASQSYLDSYMPTIITDDFTMGPYSWNQLNSEMQTNPDAFQEGTIWVKYTPSYFLDFNPNGGIGSTKSLMTPLAGTATLPDSTFLRFGYKFIGWTTQPDPISDVNPLMKPGQQFRPASPTDAARYTLYAQWEKLGDTSNLPESSQAGILPGWVQVGSENTNGLIPPMDMAIASFINKYSPDQTSITFRFLKLLDGNVPSASDTFTFDMHDESGKLVQTATNVGSTITFAPLGFDKAGVFTYFISERQDPSNKINEDDNVIQATVTVVEEDGKLKATAQLLGETTFRNETKPAELTISKKVVLPEWSDITDDDQKTFKFHVTLKKDASPLSGTFDGVTFDESGTATIEVKGNTQKTIKGIPAGTTYTVNEVDIPQGYSNTDKTNTNGNLLADSSVTSEWENTYTPVDATVQLQASKKYFDQSNTEFNLKGGEFGFSACEIIDSNTSTGCVTATNDRTGKVEFPVLTYSTPGIHTYRITEDVTSTDKSIAFDRKAYTVTVEVSDNGEGSLVSKVQYNTDDGSVPVFVNRNTVMSALPVTGSYAVWAVVFAAVVSVVWFAAPGRRRQ